MPVITILLGLVLIALGVGGYFGTGMTSITALIPAFFGVPILLLGALALKDSRRKLAMHLAVFLGLIGCLGGAVRLAQSVIAGQVKIPVALATIEDVDGRPYSRFHYEIIMPVATAATGVLAILCFIFVVLCIRSFIRARART